jgi:hypothetical protein
MKTRRIVGIILVVVGIFMAVFYSYMAYSAQQNYTQLMCAVFWVTKCTATNNALMFDMGFLAIGLVFISVGGLVVMKEIKIK